jgi:hypothetical protein
MKMRIRNGEMRVWRDKNGRDICIASQGGRARVNKQPGSVARHDKVYDILDQMLKDRQK